MNAQATVGPACISRHGNAPSVRLLVEEGADISATLPDGKTTPLVIAKDRQFKAIEVLLIK